MKSICLTLATWLSALPLMVCVASPGPTTVASAGAIAAPKDRPYPGQMTVAVDASDPARAIVHVHERLNGVNPDTVLLYPKWLPGSHAPEGPIDRVAGLKITAQGVPVSWTRDPVDVYAFRVHAPPGVKSIDVDFDYLSPPSAPYGGLEITRDILLVEWNTVVLYPAGYFARQIPVEPSLTLPAGWRLGSALEPKTRTGALTAFKTVNLETLVDSPVYAGRHTAVLDLAPGAPVAVHLDLFADRPELLNVKPEQIDAYKNLVQQATTVFGSHHYSHYDFLYSLSDQLESNGLEHHQSSEDGGPPEAFTEWDKTAHERDLLPHEFTHSWNGKFRRPADLWTPNYNVPMQDSLLWVYEGQTEYWGEVLAARSGLWTRQQALDELALTAATYDNQAGRKWRALEDTTNDEIINPRRPMAWRNWSRFEDYYQEGQLIWLEVDTLLREKSQDKRSLDDFAKAFFGIDDGSFTPVTYTFDDVVKALNAVLPFDWARFLRERLDSVGKPPPLEGIKRGGYRLVYTDTPSDFAKARDEQRKRLSLLYSIGIEVDEKDGTVMSVLWDSPAFQASLTAGTQILSVNGAAYSGDLLKEAIQAAKNVAAGTPSATAIELITKTGDRFRVLHIDYAGGLRYPHLERDTSVPARLDDILAARK